MAEMTVDEKIRYTGYIAKLLIAASVLFVGGGAAVALTADKAVGNQIMIVGLAFVALFGVALYVKKHLEGRIEAGKTFYGGK